MKRISMFLLLLLVVCSPFPLRTLARADDSKPAEAAPPPSGPPAPLSDADRAAYFELLMMVRQHQAIVAEARATIAESPAEQAKLSDAIRRFFAERDGGLGCQLDLKAQWLCPEPTSAPSK
jgi:hypothetical protein